MSCSDTKVAFKSYRDLLVWQRGVALALDCYRFSKSLPKEEMYGLTSQIRRASVSIPANIAEGHGRELTGSFVQHLRIAQGSLKELETELLIVQGAGLAASSDVDILLQATDELGRMLRALIRSLQSQPS
jgi:four helix bundle protein